ncbi:hypothetical protein K432DRAFT_291600 [Lepidopterella palustris CBS 459.81]|uniref:CST complex subunit Ten1 n=1 Tax=Lepidopterella palustris CBS 459.81 TaxID=1314670 RepID=A0A8E2EFU9_9PEZI|nr:hypothetical protein K432DRAFT_291600 [Lepidopterella palustris CBS 459.81]
MAGPLPSRLVFLSDLVGLKQGEKVRFLGCVDDYTVSSATLTLKHQHPSSPPPTVAHVNIEHVLESVKSTELEVGAWVNIIGTITTGPVTLSASGPQSRRQTNQASGMVRRVHVQALVLWSAGSLKVDAYEKALEQRKVTETYIG